MTRRPETPARLVPDPDHRYRDQWQFLRRFPGYTTETRGERLTLWYRAGDTCRTLILSDAEGAVSVDGDLALARRILQADAPALPGRNALPPDPPAHRILHRRYAGIRPVLFADPFEGIAWTILGQQITVALAARLKQNVAQRYGSPAEGAARPLFVFPSPDRVARASIDDLRSLQLSRQKAEALVGVARALAAGQWTPALAAEQPAEETITRLRQFRGIGRWSAEYILLRVLGHPDVLPAGDAALQRAWARLTGVAGRAAEDCLRRAGAAWTGRRSDFAFALWLDNLAARRRPDLSSSTPSGPPGGD